MKPEELAQQIQAALAGDVQAQMNLGHLYRLGTQVAQDHKEAVKWFRMAAAQGEAEADRILEIRYRFGKAFHRRGKKR